MLRRASAPQPGSSTLSSAWSLLDSSPAEAAVLFEAEYRAHVASGNRDLTCLAWCGAVASRFQTRDFESHSVLLGGWDFARQEFERLQGAARAHVAVSIYAVASVIRPGAPDRVHWEQMAVQYADRADADDIWLALGVAMAAGVLWLGAPIASLKAIAPKIDAVALRRRTDRSAAGWMAARLHCARVHWRARARLEKCAARWPPRG